MARRAGVTRDKVIKAAEDMIDERGPEGLTLAALATHFGVKAPSLYTHVSGIEDVRETLRVQALEALGDELQRAAVGRAGRAALGELAHAYRAFALGHPGRYVLILRGETGTPGVRAAAIRILETLTAVLRGYGLEGDDALHAVRALRSALHGFVSLELAGGFAMELDVDMSFERYIALLDGGLRA